MKAGLELDERLCGLLESKPDPLDNTWTEGDIFSTLGFWKWRAWGDSWRPIPVSTSWGAAGKAIDELEKLEYGVTLYTPNSFTDEGLGPHATHAAIVWYNPTGLSATNSTYCKGKSLSHAFALAACRALERGAWREHVRNEPT